MKQNGWSDLNLNHVIDYIEKVDGKIILGIDGFIDQVWQVIETRISKDEYKIIDKMRQFGEIIVNRGGGGMANELIKKRRSCGGFTANTGRVIGNLGLSPILLGMYGKDAVDPIFNEFKEKCTLINVGEPVISNILEFSDGKIMMPYLKELLDFDWNELVSILGYENLKMIFADADIVSLGYWSNMPGFDELITNIYDNYLIENNTKRMFFDFANIKKRSVEAIKETFNVLGGLNNRIPMTLSLNEHEAVLLFSYFDEEITENLEQVGIAAASIREKINLDEIIIHTPHYALAASKSEGTAFMVQDYCLSPVVTTGAGDTFNGGYIASCLNNLNISEKLAISNAATRFYVNNGFPPDRNQLIEEIKRLTEKLS
ncbi:carbohydrate kinase family protein [Clostridium swellfunianum]|uniref:PfkB family carbohydrate kinase n=1 Tax=Clostridium swellfunianum TaxID=1367462 RepID=UPI00202F32C7|nr:carbohydrate kinase family protein [Clostridium swellfunianum]MCM0649965.1 carbohydrate kinase family protein [Clostridium swellfunianum]